MKQDHPVDISIGISPLKYWNVLIRYGFLAFLFITMGTMIILFEDDLAKRIAIGILFPTLAILMGYLFIQTVKLRRHMDAVMLISNDVLVNHSNAFGNKEIPLDKIAYVEDYKIDQYRVVLKCENRSASALINQIKGNDIYLSSSLVNSQDLVMLIEYLRQK